MFTLIDLLVVSAIVMLFTSAFTAFIVLLTVANGNRKREEEAYREGIRVGQNM